MAVTLLGTESTILGMFPGLDSANNILQQAHRKASIVIRNIYSENNATAPTTQSEDEDLWVLAEYLTYTYYKLLTAQTLDAEEVYQRQLDQQIREIERHVGKSPDEATGMGSVSTSRGAILEEISDD